MTNAQALQPGPRRLRADQPRVSVAHAEAGARLGCVTRLPAPQACLLTLLVVAMVTACSRPHSRDVTPQGWTLASGGHHQPADFLRYAGRRGNIELACSDD